VVVGLPNSNKREKKKEEEEEDRKPTKNYQKKKPNVRQKNNPATVHLDPHSDKRAKNHQGEEVQGATHREEVGGGFTPQEENSIYMTAKTVIRAFLSRSAGQRMKKIVVKEH